MGNYLKSLNLVAGDIRHTVLIDDSELVCRPYEKNSIQIKAWMKDDKGDKDLVDCLDMLE